MASSQSSQTDNLVNCKLTLECLTSSVGFLTFKCIYCNKTYEKKFGQELSKRFKNTSVM